MNNWTTPLEKQLESWQPRRPSPACKQALFLSTTPRAHQVPAEAAPRDLPDVLRALSRLAPITAAACLALLVLGPKIGSEAGMDGSRPTGTLALAALSNQFYAAYLPAVEHSVRNNSTLFAPASPYAAPEIASAGTALSMPTNSLQW